MRDWSKDRFPDPRKKAEKIFYKSLSINNQASAYDFLYKDSKAVIQKKKKKCAGKEFRLELFCFKIYYYFTIISDDLFICEV